MSDVVGVVIDGGASDWQVFQQNARGVAEIGVRGRWGGQGVGVYLRLVREDTNVPAAGHLDWTPARMNSDGTWAGLLKDVPAGGLYRLETHLRNEKLQPAEWSQRGDVRHFLGVGDLWVIAGQSNSAGYGRGPCFDPPELGVHLLNNAMRWALASQPLNESTGTVHPANREAANSGHGPWLHWARRIRQEMGFPIGLIQTSLGGSPLVSWNPAEPGDHPLYELMLRAVEAAGGRIRGVLWYQGESDAGGQAARTYDRRFVAAVRAWRKALANPRLAVLTVQINRCTGPGGDEPDCGWTMMREAQRRAARGLAGVTVTPTLDLPLSDGIHISPIGNMLLAERVAQAALGAVYGRDVAYRAPEPAAARQLRSGKAIDLAFQNVTSRMDTIDPAAVPFRVQDARGFVPVEAVRYDGSAAVRLLLGRKLTGRAVVHGAWGFNPPTAPCDMVRQMPMLGFHGFPVQRGGRR